MTRFLLDSGIVSDYIDKRLHLRAGLVGRELAIMSCPQRVLGQGLGNCRAIR
jgi:hypothetical protein